MNALRDTLVDLALIGLAGALVLFVLSVLLDVVTTEPDE